MIAMETTVGSEGSRALPSVSLMPGPHSEEEDNEAEPSPVPGTPPPKKVAAGGWGAGTGGEEGPSLQSSLLSPLFSFQFRSLFFGSILAPTHSPQGPSPVLAEDSDGEG